MQTSKFSMLHVDAGAALTGDSLSLQKIKACVALIRLQLIAVHAGG